MMRITVFTLLQVIYATKIQYLFTFNKTYSNRMYHQII